METTTPWTCASCTYVHEEAEELALLKCVMCESARGPAALSKKRSFADSSAGDDDEDGSGGSDDGDNSGNDDDEEEEDYAFADPADEVADSVAASASSVPDPTSAAESAATEALESSLASAFAQGGSSAATKVITKEFMNQVKLQRRGANEGVVVTMPDEANGYRWAVAVTPPEDTPLFQELVAYGKRFDTPPEIQLEMLFSSDFPMSPPFVRVLRPRFAFHTGHVTVGGSICIELLTASGWSPAYTIESLLVQLRSLFVTGEARLDPTRPNAPYGEAEAREAFRRVALQHGWLR